MGEYSPDSHIEKSIMSAFDSGHTHIDWVNKIPVYVIMDKRVGLMGALTVALTPDYFERERYRA